MLRQYLLLAVGVSMVIANPITRQVGLSENVKVIVRNNTSVCAIDGEIFEEGEYLPTADPCEECMCKPPGFACTLITCEFKPGCRAVQRSDRCCPDFRCDCLKEDGTVYLNGERLDDPLNPCETCQCSGGEIICSVIRCQWRDDCEGKYTEGRCCPSYDHCPPLGPAENPVKPSIPVGKPEASVAAEEPEVSPTSAPIEASEADLQTEAPQVNAEEESVRTETQTEATVEEEEKNEETFNQETLLEVAQPEIKVAEATDSPNERVESEQTTEAEEVALEDKDPAVKNNNEDAEDAEEGTTIPSDAAEENIVAKNNLANLELNALASENIETQTEAQPEVDQRTNIPESAEAQTEANSFEGFPEENWDKHEGETEAVEAQTESDAELTEALEANTEVSVREDEAETEEPLAASVARTENLAEGLDDDSEAENATPAERNEAETEAPIEASEVATDFPVEASEAETEAPVEASVAETEAPIEASEAETQVSVGDSEAETEAPADTFRAESFTETEELVSRTEIPEVAEIKAEPESITEAVISEASEDLSENKGEVNEVVKDASNQEEETTDSILMFREPNPSESVGVVKVSVNGNEFVPISESTTEIEEDPAVVTEAVNAPSIDDHNYWLMMQANQAQETENLKGEEIVEDNVEKEIAKVAEKYGLRTSVRNPTADAPQTQSSKTEQRLQFNELRRKRGYVDSLAQYVAHFF